MKRLEAELEASQQSVSNASCEREDMLAIMAGMEARVAEAEKKA